MSRARVAEAPFAPRVVLRKPDTASVEPIRPWFGAAWLDVRGLSARSEAPTPAAWLAAREAGERAALIEVGGEPVGFLAFRLGGAGCAIAELAVRPDRRNLGYGSEAVFALEAQAVAAGLRRSTALVPLPNGLAIYFWLRIGYCPAYPADEPVPGFTAMVRDLASEVRPGAPDSGSRTAAPRSGGRAPSPARARPRSR